MPESPAVRFAGVVEVKRGAPDHWKMQKLAQLSGLPVRYALAWANGTMERLWHYTAKYHPRGDIGTSPDWAIADACAWSCVKRADRPGQDNGRAAAFVDMLLTAGWLERDNAYRLVVHDWAEHADESVKKTLKNKGLEFCFPVRPAENFQPPFLSLSFPKPEPKPEPLKEKPSPKNGSGTAHGSRFDLAELPLEWQEWTARDLLWSAERAERTFATFADYWRAKPGAAGRKTDWLATWRNWCRREDGTPSMNGAAALPMFQKRETRAQRLAREMEEEGRV